MGGEEGSVRESVSVYKSRRRSRREAWGEAAVVGVVVVVPGMVVQSCQKCQQEDKGGAGSRTER